MKKKLDIQLGFLMYHIGHLNLIRKAKLHCDKLIVGVSTAKVVKEKKKYD